MQQPFHKYFLFMFIALSIKGNTLIDSLYYPENDSISSTQSITSFDSVGVADSIGIRDTIVIVDTLKPLFYNSVSSNHAYSMNKSKINRKDFRYLGDLANQINSGFVRDLGTLGQPSEMTFYGLGYNNLSVMINGINQNDRITNSYDMYSFQSENTDSLILYSLTQSFLYNNYNNPVTMNIVDKDSIYSIPYSRIKFYQAADGEGMFDGRASLYLSKRINITLGTSNQSMDSRYNNSDFSNWLAFAKLRYMMSNKLNFIIDYTYRNSNTYLFGGVDVNAIASSELENILYDPLQASVNYEFQSFDAQSPRYQKKSFHNLTGRIISKLIPNVKSDLAFYYSKNLTEFRQNQFTQKVNLPEIIHDNEFQTFGISFNSKYSSNFFDAALLYNFESNEIDADLFNNRFSFISNSVAGLASLKVLDKVITPTVYIKNLFFNGISYFGFGLDFESAKIYNLSLHGGISYFEKPYNFVESSMNRISGDSKIDNRAIQIGINYESNILNSQITFFSIEQKNVSLPVVNQYSDSLLINEVSNTILFNKVTSGLSLNGSINTWVLGLEYNGTYYFNDDSIEKLNPDYFLFAGIYYKDILFNRNLNLKTGFNFYLYGPSNYYNYDFEKSIPFQYYFPFGENDYKKMSSFKTSTRFKVDFFLSGRIQKSAIFFFVFENILNENYFIVPYYPAPSSGLRFGVAWEFLD